MRPPTDEYSPSVFSRTTTKSMSPGARLASGDGMPGISRHGRRLTYWSKPRRHGISEPHSETWSGTVAGQPTAPKKIASKSLSWSNQSSGIMRPCFSVVVAAPVELAPLEADAELPRRGLERAQAFGHDLLADAVAGNDRDPVCLHAASSGAIILGYAGAASKHRPRAMRSIVIVALQLSLIVAIMLPLRRRRLEPSRHRARRGRDRRGRVGADGESPRQLQHPARREAGRAARHPRALRLRPASDVPRRDARDAGLLRRIRDAMAVGCARRARCRAGDQDGHRGNAMAARHPGYAGYVRSTKRIVPFIW